MKTTAKKKPAAKKEKGIAENLNELFRRVTDLENSEPSNLAAKVFAEQIEARIVALENDVKGHCGYIRGAAEKLHRHSERIGALEEIAKISGHTIKQTWEEAISRKP